MYIYSKSVLWMTTETLQKIAPILKFYCVYVHKNSTTSYVTHQWEAKIW